MVSEFELRFRKYWIPCRRYDPPGKVSQVILGVHGFGGDKESSVLSALAQRLNERGKALVCFDFPAHGKSLAADECLRVDACRQDLELVAQYIRSEYPDASRGIFATSFGAYITMLCADKLRDYRKLLRAPAVTMAQAFIDSIIPVTREQFISDGGAWCGFERKMFVSKLFYDDLCANTPAVPDERLMIIHGTQDEIIPFSAVRKLADEHENIELLPIEGADHRFKRPGEIENILDAAIGWFEE